MKKGFTLVELLGVIVILAIISGLAVVSITAIMNKSRNGIYKNFESNLEGAGRNYLIDCMKGTLKYTDGTKASCEMPKSNGTPVTITYQALYNTGFIEKLPDPLGGECNSSYVRVTRKADTGVNMDLDYKICLVCPNYKSGGC